MIDAFLFKTALITIKGKNEMLFLDVNLPHFKSDVTVELRNLGGTKRTSATFCIGRYFDKEGELLQESIFKDFVALHRQWEDEHLAKKTQ